MTDNNKAIMQAVHDKLQKATKVAGIHAMHIKDAVAVGLVGSDFVVNTLEGPVVATEDAMIYKGADGELWPQNKEKLLAKYVRGNADIYVNTTAGTQRWATYLPDPNNLVLAAKVEDRDTFAVDASWGRLTGKRGDYVLVDAKNNESMWIVKGPLFDSTYQFKAEECCGGGCGCHQ